MGTCVTSVNVLPTFLRSPFLTSLCGWKKTQLRKNIWNYHMLTTTSRSFYHHNTATLTVLFHSYKWDQLSKFFFEWSQLLCLKKSLSYDCNMVKNICMIIYFMSLAKCLSMRETKGIVASSAPQALMEQWPFGTSRYTHTHDHQSAWTISVTIPALTVSSVSLSQSLEASIQGLRIMWRNEWMKRRCSLSSPPCLPTTLPFPSTSPPPPSPPATQPETHTTDHLYRVSAEALITP